MLLDGGLLVSEALGQTIVIQLHQATHLGHTKLTELLRDKYYIPNLDSIADSTVSWYITCAQVNDKQGKRPPIGIQTWGGSPEKHWEVDFTEIKPTAAGYNLPYWDRNCHQCSDNGLAFTAKVSQDITKALSINWKLHCAYQPQSSGQVERMNQTLKARCTPYLEGFSPYKIIFGRPPPILPKLWEEIKAEIHNQSLLKFLQALQSAQEGIHKSVQMPCLYQLLIRFTPSNPSSQLCHRDCTIVKGRVAVILSPALPSTGETSDTSRDPTTTTLRDKLPQLGSYTVILITPTTVKVSSILTWLHHTRLKAARAEWKIQDSSSDPLKLRFSH
ncbi:hypothetical protein QTO34_000333, partial [Cnephaeus nilssonii]